MSTLRLVSIGIVRTRQRDESRGDDPVIDRRVLETFEQTFTVQTNTAQDLMQFNEWLKSRVDPDLSVPMPAKELHE